MTDVLFVTQDSAYPQMGVLYLMDALQKRGIESEMVASGISPRGLEAVIGLLRPKVVGMSVMTAPQISDFERHSIFIKENFPEVSIVWGGVHPTLLSDVCLRCNYIDYVFTGQGEEVFPDLVEDIVDGLGRFPRLVRGHTPGDIDRFEPAWDKDDITKYIFSERHSVRSPDIRAKEQIHRSIGRLTESLAENEGEISLSASTRRTLEELKKWDVGLYSTDRNLFYYLLTSRGCPYKCTFCSEPLQQMHGDAEGKFLWNAHSPEWFERQVARIEKILARDGVSLDGVGLWDDMFWVRYRKDPRAFRILDYMKARGLGYLIEARADQLLRDSGFLMRKLADTGCIQVFIGAESASQETLNTIRKGTKAKHYYHLMKLADEFQVALRMSFIIGFPGETDAGIGETLDLCDAIEAGDFGPWVNVSGPKIFTPYPGTIEYQRALKAGFRAPRSNAEWGGINRSTEEYLYHFPWLERNCSRRTLARLERHFGAGTANLVAH